MAAGQGTVLLNNVDQNKSKYSERDYTRSLLACKLLYKIALTSHRHLVKIVEDKFQILNCLLNQDDVRGAEDIWGNNLGYLKGNTPRQKNATHQSGNFPIPITILERYKEMTLAGDIMFINRICFINTISRHLKFMTVEHIANTDVTTL